MLCVYVMCVRRCRIPCLYRVVTQSFFEPIICVVVFLNLVGPIIVNRATLVAKQCIINNHEEFSARHALDIGGEGL